MNSEHGTVIGPNTQIQGHVQGDEDLTVFGRIDGNITCSQALVVETSGVVVAEAVHVARATINGTVVGNITATELLHISEEGRVVGDIQAPRVVLVEGASFRGMIDMSVSGLPAAMSPPRSASPETAREIEEQPQRAKTSRPAPRPVRPPRKVEKAPAPVVRKSKRAAIAGQDTLESRASAAAQAVARAVKKDAPSKKDKTPSLKDKKKGKGKGKARVPRPPTTAGRKTRAKRR